MKNRIAKAGLCLFAAGLLFTTSVYGAELPAEYDDAIAITSSAFWRKKDKEPAPGTETPGMSPSPSPSATPTGIPKDVPKPALPKATPQAETTPDKAPQASPQASPVAAPNTAPPKAAPEQAPAETPKKETSDTSNENSIDETAWTRYYQPVNPSQGNQNQGQQNQGQQGQPQNQQNQQRHNNNQNQGQSGSYYHYNNTQQRSTQYAPGVGAEIQRILANAAPSIQLDPNAYIVQHDDGLWLVMGNIRAKLDILIYVDQKNMKEAEINHGNAIPLYK